MVSIEHPRCAVSRRVLQNEPTESPNSVFAKGGLLICVLETHLSYIEGSTASNAKTKEFKMVLENFTNTVRITALGAVATAFSAAAAVAQQVPITQNAQSLIDRDDVVFLMLDHQARLMQIVEDIDQTQLRRNVAAKAMVAELFDIPVIASTSVPGGPNGPLTADR